MLSEHADQHLSYLMEYVFIGPTPPVLPTFVRAINSSNDSVTIQWKVSTIAYTPETYFVECGTAEDELKMCNNFSELVSGPNIGIQDKVYSIELNNLLPQTIYYYRVVATNSGEHNSDCCTASSSVRNVTTIECESAIYAMING